MNVDDRTFWRERDRLWPLALRRHGPFIRPTDEELDREVERLLRRAGLNSTTTDKLEHRALANEPWHRPLSDLFGGVFAPYAEVRSVWVPVAVAFARWQGQRQSDILPRVREETNAFAEAIEKIETGFSAIKHLDVRTLAAAWGQSPAHTFQDRALELQNARDEFVLEMEGRLQYHLENIKRLPRPVIEFHQGVDFAARSFTLIMAIAWYRLMQAVPTAQELAQFVDAAQIAVWPEADPEPMTAAIENVLRKKPDFQLLSSLSGFLEFTTERFWDEIAAEDPSRQSLSRKIAIAVYDDIMMANYLKPTLSQEDVIVIDEVGGTTAA